MTSVESPESSANSLCLVCGDASDGRHFTVFACRACAAFFRRSISARRTFKCRAGGECIIYKGERCMCKACRMKKCIDVGMDPTYVQHNRDGIGPRTGRRREMSSDSVSPSTAALPSIPSAETTFNSPTFTMPSTTLSLPQTLGLASSRTPMVDDMLTGYKKLCVLRKTTANMQAKLTIQNLFDALPEEPHEGTIEDCMAFTRADISLVSDMINQHFHPFNSLPTEFKFKVFRKFFPMFCCFERSFFSSKRFPDPHDLRVAITMTTYMVNAENTNFYKICQTSEHADKDPGAIFRPTYDLGRRIIKIPLVDLGVNDQEFITLVDDEFDPIANPEFRNTRQALFTELYEMCRDRCPDTMTAAVRVASLLQLIPNVHKMAESLLNSFSVAKIFNYFNVDSFLNEMDLLAYFF